MTILSMLYPSGKDWWKYLKNRTNRVTFVLSLATASTIGKKDCIIDLGCGAGQFIQGISKTKSVIGIDSSLFLLFLARRYFIPKETILICANLEHGIPIQNHAITKVFANDCFMYFKKKKFIIDECKRILKKDGAAFLTHVHNAYTSNMGQGTGIKPKTINSWTISDKDFFYNIYHHKPIRYTKIDNNKIYNYKSYSYQFSSVPKQLKFIYNSHVDFTEDVELKP